MNSEVKLKIRNEEELYHPYDPDRTTLNPDVVDYIEQKLKKLHPGDKAIIRILSDEAIDRDAVKSVFDRYLDDLAEELDRERERNHIRQLRLFIIGIAFIAIWLIVSAKTEGIGAEVLSIIGSFAIWEAANIWLVDSPQLRLKKRIVEYLSRIEIRFD